MDNFFSFAEQIGFKVCVETDVVVAESVPCLLRNGIVSTCKIKKSYDPISKKPNDHLGGAAHAVHICTDEEYDGLVYRADGIPIGNQIDGDGKSWSNISIKRGSQENPEDDDTPQDLIHRYAKQIIGAVSAAGYCKPESLAVPTPFNIPNTFEARSLLGSVQDCIRGMKVAIIGLGGTGSYILDLMAKTPVAEIHLVDFDDIDWHNLMRAPGAPTEDEIQKITRIKSLEGESFFKVCYHESKYAFLRNGVHAHPSGVDSISKFNQFLSDHPIDYAFVCIDQSSNGDKARQDVVYEALSENQIPFIDSGISITLADNLIGGSITTSAYSDGSHDWQKAVPNARVQGNESGYQNIQLPELNALAASLSVMEWRRQTGQYVSESKSYLHKFKIERPTIVCL